MRIIKSLVVFYQFRTLYNLINDDIASPHVTAFSYQVDYTIVTNVQQVSVVERAVRANGLARCPKYRRRRARRALRWEKAEY